MDGNTNLDLIKVNRKRHPKSTLVADHPYWNANFSPVLKLIVIALNQPLIGTILAIFQKVGNLLISINALMICVRGEQRISATIFTNRIGISSGPVDMSLRNSFNCFRTF